MKYPPKMFQYIISDSLEHDYLKALSIHAYIVRRLIGL